MKTLLVIWVVCFYSYAYAETNTLQQWIQTALENNRDVSVQDLKEQMSEFDADITSALPDPVFMTEFRGMPIDPIDPGQTSEWMFMLQQTFPFPGKLGKNKEIANMNVKIQNQQYLATENQVVAIVKSLYYQKIYLQQNINIYNEIDEILTSLLQVAEIKYKSGIISLVDINRFYIQQEKNRNKIVALNQLNSSLDLKINKVLGNPLNTQLSPLAEPEELMYPLPSNTQIDSILTNNNPDLESAALKIQTAELDYKLSKLDNYPDITIMGGYMAMYNMPDRLMGRISISLPFMPWSSKNTRAKTQKIQLLVDHNIIQKTDLLEKLKSESGAILLNLKSINSQYTTFMDKILPTSKQNIDLLITDFQTSSVDYADLLKSINEYLSLKIEKEKLLFDYRVKLAELEVITGSQLNERL